MQSVLVHVLEHVQNDQNLNMRDVTLNNWVKLVRTRMDVVAVEEDSLTRLRFPQSWSPSLPDQKSQQ